MFKSNVVGGNGPYTYTLADGILRRVQMWEESNAAQRKVAEAGELSD